MRRTMIALAATTGLLGFGTLGASALTPGPINNLDRVATTGGSAIQKADYCGERCQHWHHRRWVESHHWREYHHTYNRYGYNGGYGSYVVITHDNGSQTLYAHMSKVAATVGEEVVQGQVIGYVGETGDATGPHVHFEIRNGIRNPF